MKAPALSRRFTAILSALALIAVMTRALVPAGYMVGPSANGALTVTICGAGQPAYLDLATGVLSHNAPAPRDDSKSGDHTPCVFAASALLAPAPTLLAIPAPTRQQAQPALQMPSVSVGQGLAAPPPPARGPPSLI